MTEPTVPKHWRKPVGHQRSGSNPIRTIPPCYNNRTLDNRLYAQRKSPHDVKSPVYWTCKNCSYQCAYDCAQLCHTIQHRTVLIICPLNLQIIIITWMQCDFCFDLFFSFSISFSFASKLSYCKSYTAFTPNIKPADKDVLMICRNTVHR